ncbi:hypothetical protein A7C91_01205 [Thermococcus piezophilus]|uniref:Uncharacterized protein n=1 Tax=Thermococcus piezophilus TaxID=1712654 RepID=A0A172WEX9_9EURY|nr:hypothetical protein A7C91_01205 [Thermococcus piezophilus]
MILAGILLLLLSPVVLMNSTEGILNYIAETFSVYGLVIGVTMGLTMLAVVYIRVRTLRRK